MQKITTILILLIVAYTNLQAQFIFDKALGTDGTDQARDVIFTSDGSYLVIGYSQGGSIGNDGLYLSKLDTSGNILWQKWYSFIGSSLPNYATWQGSVICEVSDSGFVVGSKIDTGNTQMGLLIKFNSQGDTIFSKSDSIDLGNNVQKIMLSPDSNLLALVDITGGKALVKVDNNFNLMVKIDTFTTPIVGIEVLNNKVYILNKDSINNLWIISNDLLTVDTVDVPIKYPTSMRSNFNNNELVFYGRDSLGIYTIHKMVYTNLLGSVVSQCDTIPILFDIDINDFKQRNNNGWLFMGIHYDTQWGRDVQLYFTDNRGKILFDTILSRWSMTIQPLDEDGKKILVDNEGNYLLFGEARFGVLGGNDIFLVKYKKWNFPTAIDSLEEEVITNVELTIFPNPTQNNFSIIGLKENSNISILDITGKVIYNKTNSTASMTINSNNWAKGVYIVLVKNNSGNQIKKIVKQ